MNIFHTQDQRRKGLLDYAPNGTLRSRHPEGSKVPLDVVVEYIEQIAPALQYAHDQRLIHRDIKPENMLLGRNNEVSLGDFGTAIAAHSTGPEILQNSFGTLHYMAPEQIGGKPCLASDQYALGVVVYEWLSGIRPFNGSFHEIVTQHLSTPPPPFEKHLQIPLPVEEVVRKALAKDPQQRFASVQEFANALKQACNQACNQKSPGTGTAFLFRTNRAVPDPPTLVAPPWVAPQPLPGNTERNDPFRGSLLAPPRSPDASLNVGIPSLEISSSISPGKHIYFLVKQLITIGRAPDNMVVLNHSHVSSHHAQLELVQGGYYIVDTGSTNHIYVNGQEVKNRLLQPGDEVCIGPFKLIYTCTQLAQDDESNSIRIDALHLKKVGNKATILLNDISLAIPPRKLVALLGSTGSGKSTLLDALNGLRPAQQGKVYYNGRDYYRNLAAFSTQLGYVPQDDIVHRDLTVEHALYYAARMRLPRDFTKAQIKERINEVLEDVEMTDRRHFLVSKLSGGQRKRLSIALELLANPSVFFLDEPTSGQDPGWDRKMMFLLRKLADKGHTIVLVTHATTNINICDYVCFLCQGGRLAYYGPPDEAKAYFGKADFAEIYTALEPTEENPSIPAQAEARFKASPDFHKYVVEPLNQGPAGRADVVQQTATIKPPKRSGPWKQFHLLSLRSLELLKNDRGYLLILLLQAPVIGLVLFFLAGRGTFDATSVAQCPTRARILATSGPIVSLHCERVVAGFNTPQDQLFVAEHGGPDAVLNQAIIIGSGGDAQKILFIMAFATVLFGCINGSGAIVKEVAIYRRERAVNLGIAPYLFSKVVVLGVLCLLQSAVLVVLVNLKAPLQRGVLLDPLLEIYITLALTSLAGLMAGLAVSATAPNNDRALSFIPIIVIAQVIFSGTVFPLDSSFLKFVGMFFAAGWSIAGMGTSIGLHGDKLGQDDCSYLTPSAPNGPNPGNCSYRGDLFVSVDHPEAAHVAAVEHLLLVWLVLGVMCIALGILTACFLKCKDIRG